MSSVGSMCECVFVGCCSKNNHNPGYCPHLAASLWPGMVRTWQFCDLCFKYRVEFERNKELTIDSFSQLP